MKNYHKIIVLILATLLMISAAPAQELSSIPAAFVDIGLGTRPLGMGGAYAAIASGEDAARWNPAALGRNQGRSFGFTWTKQMNLVPYNYLAGTWPFTTFGMGLYAETAGDDVLRENTIALASGVELRQFGLLGKLVPLDKFPPGLMIGSTVKVRLASFGNNSDGGEGQVTGDAFGYALDIGLLWDMPYVEGLSTALVFHDVINNITWDSNVKGSYSEGIPRSARLGVAYAPTDKAVLALDFEPSLYEEHHDRLALGMEYQVIAAITARAGVAQYVGNVEPNRDLTVGLGINVPISGSFRLEAGMAYLFDELQNTPRAGMRFTW